MRVWRPESREWGSVHRPASLRRGIPAPERAGVLGPFCRIAGRDAEGSGLGLGLGLGLSIVRAVLERINGQIELRDATRFPSGLKVTVELNALGHFSSHAAAISFACSC